jgi:hypothetical protein
MIPAEWLEGAKAPVYPALSYADGILTYAPRAAVDSPVHIVTTPNGAKLANGEKDLTPEFRAIDSFDVSLERKEVAFSAKRDDNFDVGLVSVDGSDIHWAPADPADETSVQWAPRGNKISYTICGTGGDVVRSLHIPTSSQVAAEFPNGRVIALAWEPRGERYSVSWESVDASQRVETMRYDGTDRQMSVAPAAHVDASLESSRGVVFLRPEAMRYGEKLPLVVWRTSDRNRWNDARASLQRGNRIAVAVIDRDPDEAFWSEVRQHPWLDVARVFVVNATAPEFATSIQSAADVAAGTYRVDGHNVAVPIDVVESFAAGYIAQQLKGSPPANGRNR